MPPVKRVRVQFHEAQRTLIGHFHHEVGHYYWQLLVQNKREAECIRVFGNHNTPPYADAMAAYYQNGPKQNWQATFIGRVCVVAPLGRFRQTFALYLDIVSVLDTASHLFRTVHANFRSRSVAPLVERYQEVGILVNEFNRTAGLIDLVPEVIAAPVVEKLNFIHTLLKKAAQPKPRAPEVAPIPLSVVAPVAPTETSP